jgi:hypothetical protein
LKSARKKEKSNEEIYLAYNEKYETVLNLMSVKFNGEDKFWRRLREISRKIGWINCNIDKDN